jgi:arylsulfatase
MYTWADASAAPRHTTQYFEIVANRGIYRDGWIASTTPMREPWVTSGAAPDPMSFPWELYHVTDDFSQAHDLASQNQPKLKELQALFMEEAKKYSVLPLDSSFAERADPGTRPSVTRGRTSFTYQQGDTRIPEASAPDVKNKSWTVTAKVDVPAASKGDGMLATLGGRFGGWALFVLSGKPEFAYAISNQTKDKYHFAGPPLTPGKHTIRVDVRADGATVGGGATGTMFVDDKQVVTGHIDHTVAYRFSLDESFDVGVDSGTPVIDDYKMPFSYGGKIESVTIDLK